MTKFTNNTQQKQLRQVSAAEWIQGIKVNTFDTRRIEALNKLCHKSEVLWTKTKIIVELTKTYPVRSFSAQIVYSLGIGII